MGVFLDVIIGFPTVLYTIPLGLSLVYWLFVIVGALDIDLFDSLSGTGEAAAGVDGAVEGAAQGAVEGAVHGAAEGAVHAAAEGAVHAAAEGAVHAAAEGAVHAAAEGAVHAAAEGAVHAAAEGAVHGVAEGAADGIADGAVEAAGEGALAMIASVLRIGKVPITISMSLIFLVAWMVSGIGAVILASALPLGGVLGFLLKAGLGLGAFIGSTAFISTILRPFERAFGMKKALGANELCGKVATLTTNRIDHKFGQANIFFDEADLNIHVRYSEQNEIKKGTKLLLISYDARNNTFEVEPYAAILDELEDNSTIDRAKARARAVSAQEIKE